MFTLLQSPDPRFHPEGTLSVFLGGTIDMGASEDWQADVIDSLRDLDVFVYSPRRTDWNPAWGSDSPELHAQANWELDRIERADVVCFYFVGGSASPITLLELGIVATSKPESCLVYCPNSFWRKGNVDVVCRRSGIPIVEDPRAFIQQLRALMTRRPSTVTSLAA